MHYSKETILLLCDCIDGNVKAFNLLTEKGYKELALLNDAISGKQHAFTWLKENKKYLLLAAANAIYNHDLKAIDFLVKQKAPHWAAVSGAVNGSAPAKNWLKKHQLDEYLKLVERIRVKLKDEADSDFKVIFSSPV